MCGTLTLAQLPPSLRQQIRLSDREREVTACWEWTGPRHVPNRHPVCVLTETGVAENARRLVWSAMHGVLFQTVPQLTYSPACEDAGCVSPYHAKLRSQI